MTKRVGITEASRITGLSVYALRKGVRAGRYPAMRVCSDVGKLLFDIELLDNILAQEAMDNIRNRIAADVAEL